MLPFKESENVGNRKYSVSEIDASMARWIVKKYHYSGKVVANSQIHLGIFCEGDIVGCLQYGPPMNGGKTLEKLSTFDKAKELNRMVMVDTEPRNSESRAISLCNKWLRKNTNLQWILSFSDGKENNVGYIYQASNWKYLGYRLSDSFYDLDGTIMHNVSVWHKFKEKHEDRDIKTTDEILCDNFENVSKILCKQHIYVFPLYKNVKFKFDEKPYPKKDQETAIIQRKWIKKDGIITSELETFCKFEKGII